MTNNKLVLLDQVIGFVLLPLCILIRLFRKAISRIDPIDYQGILIIKFLGAGNFLAISKVIEGRAVDVITAKSNENVIKNFGIGNKAYIIDDSNFFRLLATSSICCMNLFFKHYHQVINLETESKFAKFLTALTSARILSGVSNAHKSYIDLWLYDKYLVNPLILNKPDLIAQLEEFHPVVNKHVQSAIAAHCDGFDTKGLLGNVFNVAIAPTCSNTDHLRRLSVNEWAMLLGTLNQIEGIREIFAIFPDNTDPQYLTFLNLQSRFDRLKVKVTSYAEFMHYIESSDLLITIDSQALHLRQQFNKVAIAIYGPTSPFGVSLADTTYPITSSLVCSPCTHKYLRLPCHNAAPCMGFTADAFRVFSEINKVS